MKPKYIAMLILDLASLLFFLTASVLAWFTANSLPDQQAAARWSGSERYAQVSVYTEETHALVTDGIFTARVNIEKKLAENSFAPKKEKARVWTDAFSSDQLKVSASTERAAADASLIVTGGDFFLFHPQDILYGYYYSDDDTMQDRIVIDDVLAWQLYGASNIVGKPVIIDGKYYYVAGVCRRSENSDIEKVYGSKPRIFMPYRGYEMISSVMMFSCYEVCLPNSVTGLGKQMLMDSIGIEEENCRVVENSERFSLKNRFELLLGHSVRSVVDIPIVYPYWENAARIAEDRSVLLLVMQIIGLICPVFTVIYFLRKLIRNRKELFRKAIDAITRKAKQRSRKASGTPKGDKTAVKL